MTAGAALLDRLHKRAFAPSPPDIEVLVRSLLGALIVWWSLTWVIDAGELLSDQSPFPTSARRTFSWTVFALGSPTWWVVAVLLLTTIAGIALAIGRHPRPAAAVAFIGVVSTQRLQPAAANAGDQLLRVLLVWMVAALILGSTATITGSLRSPGEKRPRVFIAALRFQVILIYTTSVIWKIQGEGWRSGEAVWSALNNPSVSSVALPSALSDTTVGIAVLTYGVLLTEAGLPLLLLRARRWGVAVAWALHLGFAVFLRVGIFTPVMLIAVLAFLEPEDLRRQRGSAT